MKQTSLILLLLTLLSLSACDREEATSVLDQAKDVLDSAQRQIAPVADDVSNRTNEELQKITTIEYKTMIFEKNVNDRVFEQSLQALGQDRWDCFEVIPYEDRLTVVCKRLPISYLKLLSRIVF